MRCVLGAEATAVPCHTRTFVRMPLGGLPNTRCPMKILFRGYVLIGTTRWPMHAFFTVHFFRLDHMHVMDLKGTTALWMGSVLRLIVNGDFDIGANQQERLDHLNADLDRFHRTNKSSSQLTNLRLTKGGQTWTGNL